MMSSTGFLNSNLKFFIADLERAIVFTYDKINMNVLENIQGKIY